jgi:hypothetical protein
MPAPVTQNGLTITWDQWVPIPGYPSVSGTLTWNPVAAAGGQPTSGYYVLRIDQAGNNVTQYFPGENTASIPFTVDQGIEIYFSVAACFNSNIPPHGSGCPSPIGNITATAPSQ